MDYNEPTTPSNTAHYALIPRPVSPKPSPRLALVSASAGGAQPSSPHPGCASSPVPSSAQSRSRKNTAPTPGDGPRAAGGSSKENGRAAVGSVSWTRSGRSYGGVAAGGSGASVNEKRGGRRGHGSGHVASSRLSGVSGKAGVDARDGGVSPSSPVRGVGHRGAHGGSGRVRARSRAAGCGVSVGDGGAGAPAPALVMSDDSVEMRDASGLRPAAAAAARRPSNAPDESALGR